MSCISNKNFQDGKELLMKIAMIGFTEDRKSVHFINLKAQLSQDSFLFKVSTDFKTSGDFDGLDFLILNKSHSRLPLSEKSRIVNLIPMRGTNRHPLKSPMIFYVATPADVVNKLNDFVLKHRILGEKHKKAKTAASM